MSNNIEIKYCGETELESGLVVSFEYVGGAYIEVIVCGKAIDVINVYDYEAGKSTITSADDVANAINEYLNNYDEAYLSELLLNS